MLEVALVSLVAGVILTLLAQCLWLRRRFRSFPAFPIPHKSQTDPCRLPKELMKLLSDPDLRTKKESCLFLNLIFQFLFRELKDTKLVRRWVVRKMNAEFAELLQTTSGKLLDQISVRDMNFGVTFPVIHHSTIKHIETSEDEQCLEELDVALDIEYKGGFHLAVDADLVFGKSAYLFVKVMELKGLLRLQLTRHPYTHWSLSFYEEPMMEFDVESRFEGRPIPQLTSLIVNQIRRSMRKKHTLPNYKMRYKPFFIPPDFSPPIRDLYFQRKWIALGQMDVNVIECSRLLKPPTDSLLYCTIAVDYLPWSDLIRVRKTYMTHDVEVNRLPGQPIGLLFKDDFLLERHEAVIVIEFVNPDSPAAHVDLRKNDILVAVGGHKVSSQKHAAKLLRNAGDKVSIRLERAMTHRSSDNSDLKFEEDVISVKDSDQELRPEEPLTSGEEDFVNISIRSCNGDAKTEDKASQKRSGVTSLLRRRTKSAIGEKKGGDSPQNSPESRRRTLPGLESEETTKDPRSRSPVVSPKKRIIPKSDNLSHSDPQLNSPRKKKTPDDKYDTVSYTEEDSESDSDLEDQVQEMKKTNLVTACQDPLWNEWFKFEVEEGQKYLNLCVWCKIPEKVDRNDKLLKAEKDILLGYASLSVNDIALDCLMTLQGDSQLTVPLSPVETKAGASRAKLPNLAAHPGFDPNLCFGDITLGFRHSPQKLTLDDRKRLTKQPVTTQTMEEPGPGQNTADSTITEKLDEGLHDFIGMQFHSATYCHFCGKKIWLKTAFQCRSCHMICHKKCTDKCQAQASCKRDGVKRSSEPELLFKRPVNQVDSDKKRRLEESVMVQKPGGILSKFRKDSTGKKGKSPSSSPGSQRKLFSSNQLFVRRRNSAPDDEAEGSQSTGSFLGVDSLPRTRSTTSLQSLVDQNASPSLRTGEFSKNGDKGGESSGEEGEITMSQSAVMNAIRPSGHGQNVDEIVVMAAKQMGRELFAHLTLTERKEKLDAMVSKLQQEVDVESEHRAELGKAEQEMYEPGQKRALQAKIVKADEKIQALMVLMLHYCAGLQHCMDLEEERRQQDENSDNSDSSQDHTLVLKAPHTVVMREDSEEESEILFHSDYEGEQL